MTDRFKAKAFCLIWRHFGSSQKDYPCKMKIILVINLIPNPALFKFTEKISDKRYPKALLKISNPLINNSLVEIC